MRISDWSSDVCSSDLFQFHGVIKTRLKATTQAINAAMIDTIAACGDVSRNVVVAANPHLSRSHAAVHAQAAAVSAHMLPRTRAYYEIWLRSEEHTYELQFLMRHSSAALCLPKQK